MNLGDEGAGESDEEYLPDIGQGVQQVVPQDPTPGRGCLRVFPTGRRGDPTAAQSVEPMMNSPGCCRQPGNLR